MNMQNSKMERILLVLAYIVTFLVLAYVSVSLFVQATHDTTDSDYRAEMTQKFNNYLPQLPEELSFCGERVPLENFDVREALEAEMIKVMYMHSSTFLYIKRSNRYFPILRKILHANKIHDDFLYLCVTESGLDHLVSPAKAVGFWQILETTGKENGLEISAEVDERYNIEKATEVACKYFHQAYAKFGNWTLAAASYNCGQAGMQRVVSAQGNNSYYNLRLNTETGRYIYRILAYKVIMSAPEKYGFIYREKDLYPTLHTETLSVDTTLTDLYAFGRDYAGTYKMLKMLNPWLRDTKLTNKDGKIYSIKVLKEGERANVYK